jgi:hypothetical protein
VICYYSFFVSSAQDTITKISGEIVVARVLEIGSTEIKYKKFDLQDGPDFIDLKSNIKSIRYANGQLEQFQTMKPVTEIAVPVRVARQKIEPFGKRYKCGDQYLKESKMYRFVLQEDDPALRKAVKKAKSMKWKKYIGFGAIPFGAATVLYYGIYKLYSDPSSGFYDPQLASAALFDCYTEAAITVACGTIGITYNILHKKQNKKVVNMYNSLP